MARPKTGQTPPISFRPPPQLLKDFDATVEEGRSRSDVLIELMHDRVTKKHREQEKLRRERDLLLTTFDPSEFDSPPTPVFTEPGPGAAQLTDDTSPERMSAWLEKEQARLRQATGFDLSERPVSSEEKTG